MNNRDKWLKVRCKEVDNISVVPEKNGIGHELMVSLQGADYSEMLEFLFAKDGYSILFSEVSDDMAYDLVSEYEEEFRRALKIIDENKVKNATN